jgi:phosphonate transport system substrate-binding protein
VESSLTFAYDGNFRFDAEDSVWAEFFERHRVRPVRYDDMAKLTEVLRSSVQTVAYLPAADYFYVRDMPDYEPFASAVYAAEDTTSLVSLLVVRSSSDVTALGELRGATLGFVHEYCTTSYFAPALLVHELGSSLNEFFGGLVRVRAYEPQIDAVIAGQADATMVQEDVWRKHPLYAESTRVIARREDLPSPVMIIDGRVTLVFRRDLHQVVFSRRPELGPDTLFSGFVDFRRAQVERFFAESDDAIPALTAAG